jgi:hypothetical protein
LEHWVFLSFEIVSSFGFGASNLFVYPWRPLRPFDKAQDMLGGRYSEFGSGFAAPGG